MGKYSVSESVIFCDKEEVGVFDVDTGRITLVRVLANAAENTVKALIYDKLVARIQEKSEPRGRTLIEVFADEPAPILDLTQPPVPDPPECLPHLGDMTPAYIEWMKTWFPVDFEKQYKGRLPKTAGLAIRTETGDIPDNQFGRDPSEEWK